VGRSDISRRMDVTTFGQERVNEKGQMRILNAQNEKKKKQVGGWTLERSTKCRKLRRGRGGGNSPSGL